MKIFKKILIGLFAISLFFSAGSATMQKFTNPAGESWYTVTRNDGITISKNYVGVLKTNPSYALDVNGTVNATAFIGAFTISHIVTVNNADMASTANYAVSANYALLVGLANTVATANYTPTSNYASNVALTNTVATANYAVTSNYSVLVALANTVATANYAVTANYSVLSNTANYLASYPSYIVTNNYYSAVTMNERLLMQGNGLVWNDIAMPATNLRPGNTPPDFAEFTDGIYSMQFLNSQTDEVYGSAEMLHDYAEGTSLNMHIHWAPSSTNSGNVSWNMEYAYVVAEGGAFVTGNFSPIVTGNGTASKEQYSAIGTIPASAGLKVGSIVLYKLSRTSGDPFTGNAWLFSVGIHYQSDTLGSRTEKAK